MSEPEDDVERRFVREIERQTQRAQRARHSGFWQGLALVGGVGWMVSLPAVGGALLGRWVDARFATGIFWTLSLLTIGLAIGCASAWRHVHRELK